MTQNKFCTACGADVTRYKKIVGLANMLFNDGLEKAHVRDLSGAVTSLRRCLKLDKNNVDARNLLGLVYFEMGEYVSALNEWVISKNLKPNKNIADDYISMLQDNPGELDTYSQAVKKYNQALSYCYQGTIDLAVIQLKKVVSLNPKYVQAHQLLALLYLCQEQWEDAKKELLKCQKVDVNNTTTLRYLKEAEAVLNIDEETTDTKTKKSILENSVFKKEKDIESYTPISHHENRAWVTILNVIAGIVIGVAVSYLLILPARITEAKEGMDESLKSVNEQLDARTAKISELEQELKTAENQNDKLKSELDIYIGEDGTMTAMDNLLQAVELYLNNPESKTEIADSLDRIDESTLDRASESFTQVYTDLMGKIGSDVGQSYYDTGMRAYQNETYEEAIDNLTKAYSYDNTNGDALFNLGNAYRKSGDVIRAIDTYQKVIESFPDTEMATRSQQFINELNNE
ncbi:tetratricopeptide repeat protein [Lacrimispora saccharolytica]|uniref:tetratricopeptide repeat protein n=1 Tax=Lacrimispora saccharolytica TaxID=84030 RepID=UPI00265CE164|nr:tetratricopeptide repeat protein [Lacrimispora saccharolytica]